MGYPIVSEDPWIQQHYEACRAEGTSHTLAEMFAFAQPPASNTDREFLAGHVNGSQFAGREGLGDHYKKEAEAAGVSTNGKVYMGGLAAYPGDPKAWVDGRGDVERVCRERGYNCRGQVNVQSEPVEPAAPIDIGEDIVDREVASVLRRRPEPRPKKRAELREKIRSRLKPHWAKKK